MLILARFLESMKFRHVDQKRISANDRVTELEEISRLVFPLFALRATRGLLREAAGSPTRFPQQRSAKSGLSQSPNRIQLLKGTWQ